MEEVGVGVEERDLKENKKSTQLRLISCRSAIVSTPDLNRVFDHGNGVFRTGRRAGENFCYDRASILTRGYVRSKTCLYVGKL